MLQETVSMTKGTLGYETTVTSTEKPSWIRNALKNNIKKKKITSTENKRWLLKPLCDKHRHLVLAVWKRGYLSHSYLHTCYTNVPLHVCSLNSGSANTPI